MTDHPVLFTAVILIWLVLFAAIYRRLLRPLSDGKIILAISFLFLVAACYALLANWNLSDIRVHIIGSIACLLLAISISTRLPQLATNITSEGVNDQNGGAEAGRKSGRIQWAVIVLIFFAAAFISIAFNHI